jgi:D-alanyl-D-alanine dipeptidase
MATARVNLTPAANTAPAVVNIPQNELSGAQWVPRFPTSASIDDLNDPFRSDLTRFITELRAAGATVVVSATYRPTERAYLMHYSSRISRSDIRPENVPSMVGVNINWVHPTPQRSTAAATAMANGYNIVFPPALQSRHTQRRAVDMTISGIMGRSMQNANGRVINITSQALLHQVGATYGVIKLVSDPPHWSDDGH